MPCTQHTSRMTSLAGLRPSLPTTTSMKPGPLQPPIRLIFVPTTIRRLKRQASNNYAKLSNIHRCEMPSLKPPARLINGSTHRLARRASKPGQTALTHGRAPAQTCRGVIGMHCWCTSPLTRCWPTRTVTSSERFQSGGFHPQPDLP